MNFNYEKIRAKVEHGGNHWTSYSDLFLVLSVVFLLLYVVSNLRSGTMSFASHTTVQAMKQEAEDLRKQIKVYETLREDYLKKDASQDEITVYQELMGKLTLLEDEAKSQRKELFQKAKEASEKEQNLNHYQALVKNIISANLVASSRVKKRDNIIEVQEQDIQQLNTTVQEKEKTIATNNDTISGIETKLSKQIEQVKYAYRSKKNAQTKMAQVIAGLKTEGEKKIANLRDQNTQYMSQLEKAQSEIVEKKREAEHLLTTLNQKEAKYSTTISDLQRSHEAAMDREKKALEQGLQKEAEYQAVIEKKQQAYKEKMAGLSGELEKTRAGIKDVENKYQGSINSLKKTNESLTADLNAKEEKYNTTVSNLRGAHEAAMAREKKAFEQGQQKEAEYLASIAKKQAAFNEKMAGLSGELEKTRAGIKEVEGKYEGTVSALKKTAQNLETDLKASNAKLNAQRMLARRIEGNFKNAGIKANVDEKSGDVTINFQDEYFETGRSDLKNKMKQILEKTMPVYAKSLLHDKGVADKISSIEIIGFASPTYKGKYINPNGLSETDRQAVNYNMDLSYQRAKSIFEYVFDTNRMQFENQKALLPLVKVSGRSYLATDRVPANSTNADITDEQYCQINDCKKSQKVIIKFNLKEE